MKKKHGEWQQEKAAFLTITEITVIARKPTLMDQKAQEGKQVFQQYSWTSLEESTTRRPEEAFIHTAEMTALKIAITEIQKKRKHEMGNIYTR